MNIAAYCRVSTDKEDQLNSLEAQKAFFAEYTIRTGDTLIRLYADMYTDDLISREELNTKIGGMRKEIERLENELKMVSYHLTKGEQLEYILGNTFKAVEDITDVHQMTNEQLKQIIQKIEVDKEGNVDIFLRLFGDLGLEEAVLIENTSNTTGNEPNTNENTSNKTENMPNIVGNKPNTPENNNVLNANDHT